MERRVSRRCSFQVRLAKTYGLVISDFKMAPMSGLDLLRAVRADEALRATRYILTTASMDPQTVLSAKRAGVDSYLLKPFTPKQLVQKLEAL
jgi:two-component system, chemotaxis family, chemotaxis protein CheY